MFLEIIKTIFIVGVTWFLFWKAVDFFVNLEQEKIKMITIKWNKPYTMEWLCFKFIPKNYY